MLVRRCNINIITRNLLFPFASIYIYILMHYSHMYSVYMYVYIYPVEYVGVRHGGWGAKPVEQNGQGTVYYLQLHMWAEVEYCDTPRCNFSLPIYSCGCSTLLFGTYETMHPMYIVPYIHIQL